MIEHLSNIKIYTEESYSLAESDVNISLKNAESYNESSSKTTYIHFPIIEYGDELQPRGTFQKIYTLLMSYSETINLLDDLKDNEENRTFLNLRKLKKYLYFEDESTFENLKIQYNIFYDKIMGHSKEVKYIIDDFENCILSNLLLKIYGVNSEYLNKNKFIEQLNNFCKRNTITDIQIYLEWGSFLCKTREPFDEIIIPTFTPESIIKLFTLKNEKNENKEGLFSLNFINKKNKNFLIK